MPFADLRSRAPSDFDGMSRSHRKRYMTITLSKLNVATNAPTGTAVGLLTARDGVGNIVPCNFILTKRAGGYFSISGNNLITAWKGSITPGYYSVRVRANGIHTQFRSSADFTVVVVEPLPPTPNSITFISTTASLPDNSVSGTTVAVFSVSMSDDSAFSGTLSAGPASTVAISGGRLLVLARGLSSADDGSHLWGVTATQNGVMVSSSFTVQVARANPPPPPPSGLVAEWTLDRASVSGIVVTDASGNGHAGTVVNGPLTFTTMPPGANFNSGQYVDVPIQVNSAALTVSAWFNAASFVG